ncbi:MAG: FtsX-like permease family protein [Bacteroidaceae bacterium]|nr:FtsX-like permease family protein [Bacteroidaceae bacterium]
MKMKLTFHNIRIAWRNLMKYKLQNIIAVLCLAVGMVCFSIGFLFTQRAWESFYRTDGDPKRQSVQLYDQKGDSLVCVGPEILKRINDKHLGSIECIDLNYGWLGTIATFFDLQGDSHSVSTQINLITPEYLHYLGLRSVITGKRIPVLKPGDLIMTKGMLERTFGLDVNPIGYTTDELKRDWRIGTTLKEYQVGDTIYYDDDVVVDTTAAYGKIIDVVDTGDWMLAMDNLLVVTNLMQEFLNADKWHHFRPYKKTFCFILAKGKKPTDLLGELQNAFPEYEVRLEGRDRGNGALEFSLLMIVASSILLIGLFGFLKMQIQLFRLRQREMGLRQCMGAQQSQLFSLMMWEVAIVFLFVTLLTLGLTYLLASYAIPIIQNIASGKFFNFNMPLTYTTELWICLAVFLLTIVIALLSIRQVVKKPLSEVVGKSHKASTRGRTLLIVLQMTVCIIFLFIAFGFGTDLFNSSQMQPKVTNTEAFRNCIVSDMHEWRTSVLDSMAYYPHVQNYTSIVTLPLCQYLKDGETPPGRHWEQTDENGQRFYVYQAVLTDEHLFEILDLEVQPTATKGEIALKDMIPIYVPTERAAQLRQKLGVKAPKYPQHRIIEKDKEAECVGYFQGKLFTSLMWNDFHPVFFYVTERGYFSESYLIDFRVREDFVNGDTGWSLHHYVVVQAKQGQYEEAVKELSERYQELSRYTTSRPPLDNLYDVCFKELRMLELILQIVAILTAIAVLCIVLTLFSSVSLDVRGRQKEVAIRKAHGASQWQIIWLFGKHYIYCLFISILVSLILCVAFALAMGDKIAITDTDDMKEFLLPIPFSILFIALVTLLTVGYKIYRVSKLDPATIIKKE